MKGIVFDFGGVITLAQDGSLYRYLEERLGWSYEMVRAGWKKYRRLMDADKISIEELYLRMASDLNQPLSMEEAIEIGQRDYDSWAYGNPETIAWMKDLSKQGYRVGILTNMPSNYVPWFNRAAAEARAIAHAEVISGFEHLAKPQPEIYRLMEQRMGLAPENLFFFDDILENVEGAKNCGWKGALFTTVDAAKKDLEAICF